MRSGRGVVVLLVIALSAATLRGQAADESLVFTTPVERLEPAVREQVEEAHAAIRGLESRDAPADERGEAYGILGGLYFVYELHQAATETLARAAHLAPDDPRWPYLRGLAAEASGDLDLAATELSRTLEILPSYVPAMIHLGRIELARNRPEAAARWFRRALDGNPDSPAAEAGLGEVARLEERWEDARRHLGRALELQPGADALHYSLGLVHRELGDLDAAREHLAARGPTEAVEPDPFRDAATLSGRGTSLHLERGNRAMSEEAWNEAAEHYRRALQEEPESVRARQALASALARGGRTDEALEEYRRVVERVPDSAPSRYNLGLLLIETGELDEAAAQLRAAVEAAPDFGNAYFNLALVLEQLGRLGEAETVMARAEAVVPEDPEPSLERARLRLALGDPVAAEEVLDDLFARRELPPAARSRAFALRATIRGQQGRFAEAAREYELAAEAGGPSESIRFGQATALLLAGDHAAARRVLEAAVREMPESVPLTHVLARLLATSSDPDVRQPARALELARQVVRQAPGFDRGETVGMALAALGRYQEAADWQRRIIEEARRRGRPDLLPALELRLRSYEAGKPVLDPWAGGD